FTVPPGSYLIDFTAVNPTRDLTGYTTINCYGTLPDLSITNETILPAVLAVPDPSGRAPRAVALPAESPVRSGAPAEITFSVPTPGLAKMQLVDIQGRAVATLVNGPVAAGRNQVTGWRAVDVSGRALAAGVYFLRLQFAGAATSRRMVVIP